MVKYTVKNRKRTYRKRTHKKKTHGKRTYKKKNTKLKGGLGFNKGISVKEKNLNKINSDLESKINNIDDILLSIENIGFRKYKFTSSYKNNGVIETKVIEKKTSDYNKLLTSLNKIPPISIDNNTGKHYLNLSTEHFVKNVKDIMKCTDMLFFTKSQRTIECMKGTIEAILNYSEDWTKKDYTNICEEKKGPMMNLFYCTPELKEILDELDSVTSEGLEERIRGESDRNERIQKKIKHIKLKRYSIVLIFLGILE